MPSAGKLLKSGKLRKAVLDPLRAFRHFQVNFAYRLCRQINGFAFPPLAIYLSVNNICNLRCKMCDIGQDKRDTFFAKNAGVSTKIVAFKTWQRFLAGVASFRPEINIGMTEPLLYEELFPLVKEIKRNKLRCGVVTNGFLLDEKAQGLIDAGADRIDVSLDGTKEIHDRIRGREGSFTRALEGIRKVAEIKRSRGLRLPNIRILYTINEHNYGCIFDFVSQIKELSAGAVVFQHFSFVTQEAASLHNRLHKELPITASSVYGVDPQAVDTEELFSQISRVKKEFSTMNIIWLPDFNGEEIRVYYKDTLSALGKLRCMVPWVASQVNSDGDVVPLSRCFNIVLGNIAERDFLDIWNGQAYRKIREGLRQAGAYPACLRCCALSPA